MPSDQEIVDIAQDLLSDRFGDPQQLSEIEPLSGSGSAVVLRAKSAPSPFFQYRSVVLKYIPVTGDPLDDVALLREIAAYQFTNALSEDTRPGPVLLAHDAERRIIVLSDSGDGDTFAHLLERDDREERVQILRNLGTSLGRMHAGTADKHDAFYTLISRILRKHPEAANLHTEREQLFGRAIETGLRTLQHADIATPELVREFAAQAEHRLTGGGSRAFTPFDLSPDNIIVADRTQFLDYEWANFHDVSFDLACVIAGFPQYLSAHPINDDEAAAFVEAWVAEVGDTWPNAKNEDLLHARILAALVGWASASVAMMQYGTLGAVVEHVAGDDELPGGLDALLRPADAGPFELDELLARRDLYETFEALARFTRASKDPKDEVVAVWANEVAERVRAPRIT